MPENDVAFSAVGIAVFAIVAVIVVAWVLLPLFLLTKLEHMLKSLHRIEGQLKESNNQLHTSNDWAARNDAYNEDRRKRESFSR